MWNTARLLSLAAGGITAELIDVRIVYVAVGLLLFVEREGTSSWWRMNARCLARFPSAEQTMSTEPDAILEEVP